MRQQRRVGYAGPTTMQQSAGYLRAVRLVRDSVRDFKVYPFSIPSIESLDELELDAKVTFLIGENGSGKSTLIEAIAVLAGFNAEGGSKNFRFGTRRSESCLHQFMRPVRGQASRPAPDRLARPPPRSRVISSCAARRSRQCRSCSGTRRS